MSGYAAIFAINLALELPVAWLLLRRHAPGLSILAAGVAGNALTHPLLHFGFPRWLGHLGLAVLVGEIVALTVEAGLYALMLRPRPRSRALLASAGANFVSLGVGALWLWGTTG